MASERASAVGKRRPGLEKAQTLQGRIRRYSKEWLTFLDHPGVPPTNNLAEQAVRFLVILRKLTFGSRTRTGAAHRRDANRDADGQTTRAGRHPVPRGLVHVVAQRSGPRDVRSLLMLQRLVFPAVRQVGASTRPWAWQARGLTVCCLRNDGVCRRRFPWQLILAHPTTRRNETACSAEHRGSLRQSSPSGTAWGLLRVLLGTFHDPAIVNVVVVDCLSSLTHLPAALRLPSRRFGV